MRDAIMHIGKSHNYWDCIPRGFYPLMSCILCVLGLIVKFAENDAVWQLTIIVSDFLRYLTTTSQQTVFFWIEHQETKQFPNRTKKRFHFLKQTASTSDFLCRVRRQPA